GLVGRLLKQSELVNGGLPRWLGQKPHLTAVICLYEADTRCVFGVVFVLVYCGLVLIVLVLWVFVVRLLIYSVDFL
ncbi:hypothetical protein ACTHSM_11830, partial [Neisseria sp. P0009.S001]|uniref:hypothetical protein n=1 Tax=Neisseria sp. P0009.S001 TaxID=3436708 RepID=UPI003F7F1D6A